MDKITRVFKTNPMKKDEFEIINKKTGEINEFGDRDVYQKIPTKEVKYNYENYVYLNTGRLMLLLMDGKKDGLKPCDLALLIEVSCNLSYAYNICMRDKEMPHSTLSISEMIGNTEQATKKKLNRLIELRLLALEKIPGKKEWGKVYIVNPYFIRIGDKFSDLIPKIFKDLF